LVREISPSYTHPERRDFLFASLRESAEFVNCQIVEVNGEENHIHFLLDTPPTVVLSELIGKLKSKTAAALLDRFGPFFTESTNARCGAVVSLLLPQAG
jgi:REP element-mobilizing transposase RayT